MEAGIQEIFIKGRIYIINLVLVLDGNPALNKKKKEFIFSFAIENGKLQTQDSYFAEICAAYGITDTKEIETMIYHELILYLLERERQYQWNSAPYKNLRQNLLQMMKENRMSVSDVASKAGITEDEIRGILSGDTVTAVTLFKLCLVFRVNTNCMFFQDGRTPDAEENDGIRQERANALTGQA